MKSEQSPLTAITARPNGVVVNATAVNGGLLVTLRNLHEKVWFELDGVHHDPELESMEDLLASIANRLICCRNCPGGANETCQQQSELIAARMQKLLGDDGYEKFLAGAPILARGT